MLQWLAMPAYLKYGELLRLGIEDHTTHTLPHRHAQVDIQANARDPHSRIALVRAREVGVVVMVVVAVAVGMAHVESLLGGLGRHGCRFKCCRCRCRCRCRGGKVVVYNVRPIVGGAQSASRRKRDVARGVGEGQQDAVLG